MTYAGMNAHNGHRISDMAHIRQSITDIMTTPIAARCMRRAYGSLLPELIDQPQNLVLRLKIMSATYSAIMRWEPRVTLQGINFINDQPGQMAIHLQGRRTDTAETFTLSIPLGSQP